VSYRGFTWNLTESDARQIQDQLERYLAGKPIHKIDEKIISDIVSKCKIFRELSPDGATPSHASADA